MFFSFLYFSNVFILQTLVYLNGAQVSHQGGSTWVQLSRFGIFQTLKAPKVIHRAVTSQQKPEDRSSEGLRSRFDRRGGSYLDLHQGRCHSTVLEVFTGSAKGNAKGGFDLHGKVRVACTDGQKTRVCAVVRQDQSVDTWWYMKRSCKKGLQPSSAHHTHPLLNTCSTLQCAKHAPFLRHAKLLNSKHLSQEPESCSARLGQSELLWQFEVKTHGGCSRLLGPRWDCQNCYGTKNACNFLSAFFFLAVPDGADYLMIFHGWIFWVQ